MLQDILVPFYDTQVDNLGLVSRPLAHKILDNSGLKVFSCIWAQPANHI